MDTQGHVIHNAASRLTVSGSCVHGADWVQMDKRARNRALLYAAQSGCLHCVESG